MHSRRGFTLVEVLVALGLLVLIASLALPVALTNTASARATTAERILQLAPNTARGEAQRRSLPVALVLLPSEDGQELRLVLVRQPDPQSDSARDQAADMEDLSTWPTVDQPRLMPKGTRLWTGDLEELDAFEAAANRPGTGGDSMLDRAFTEDDAEGAPADAFGEAQEPVVLAWYLSDGSAMAGQATAVRLADGRVVRVRVEALTGRLVFTPAPELEEELENDASSDDPEQDLQPPAETDAGDEPADGPAFDDLEFEQLGFEELDFEDMSSGFDREGSDAPSRSERDGQPSEEGAPDSPGRPNPQPPQPR